MLPAFTPHENQLMGPYYLRCKRNSSSLHAALHYLAAMSCMGARCTNIVQVQHCQPSFYRLAINGHSFRASTAQQQKKEKEAKDITEQLVH